jgi:MFS family permease
MESRLYRRVAIRLVPLLFLGYVVAYLNRVNIGFAKLGMATDLKFGDEVYGLGAGVFFIGYFIFEVPGNLLMHRIGARVWIARIMITWGLISGATMWVSTPLQFYVSRFALGVAEAGFFPGIIFCLSNWFPANLRARIVSFFVSAIAVSGIVGGPLSGWIMQQFAGWHGLAGWKSLFFLEAAPSVVLGIVTLAWMPDSIARAEWLSEQEKTVLERAIADEDRAKISVSLRQVFIHPLVWGLAVIYFNLMVGLYGLSFWMPQIIHDSGVHGIAKVGLLSSVPYMVAAVVMILVGRNSDRTGERRWHCTWAVLAAAAGYTLIAISHGNVMEAMAGLILATSGILSAMPLFWTFPTALLSGAAAAAGIALINAVGNLGGFACPYVTGALNESTHSQAAGLYVTASCLAIGAGLIFTLLRQKGPA